MTVYLPIDAVIEFNQQIAGDGAGLRDRSILEGALGRPSSGFDGRERFADVWSKAAVLLSGIASTQAFFDGNKRTAWAVCEAFLDLNGSPLGAIPTVQAEAFVLAVAGGLLEENSIIEWLRAAARPADSANTYSALAGDGQGMAVDGGTVQLALFATNGRIADLVVRNATIVGPAIVTPGQGTSFSNCGWDTAGGGPDAVVWEIDVARSAVVGAIGLTRCVFERCEFIGVGYAAPSGGIALFLENSSV